MYYICCVVVLEGVIYESILSMGNESEVELGAAAEATVTAYHELALDASKRLHLALVSIVIMNWLWMLARDFIWHL